MNYPGFLIRRERLRRSWSQDGLCKGVCTVSYLSKIEQGKANVSPQIVSLLMQRLELPWHEDADTLARARALADEGGEALYSGDWDALAEVQLRIRAQAEPLLHCPLAPELELLLGFSQQGFAPLDTALEPCLDQKQLALQRALQQRFDEAVRMHPCALLYQLAGTNAYCKGRYAAAMEYLQSGYELAAKEGRVHLMARCRMLMGNCCSDRGDISGMEAHYAVAARLARVLNDTDGLRALEYNTASTRLELGDWQSALAWFEALPDPDALALHKLAICYEKAGERDKALAALARAAAALLTVPEVEDLFWQMCALVRYRLEHSAYLDEPAYGELLLTFFAACRKRLPAGYANFHLPWVLEWHTARRQYKQAYDLLLDFPVKQH